MPTTSSPPMSEQPPKKHICLHYHQPRFTIHTAFTSRKLSYLGIDDGPPVCILYIVSFLKKSHSSI